MKLPKRQPSEAPVKVAEQVTDVTPTNKEAKEKVSHKIHWAYGTTWGIASGIVGLTGLKGLPAAAVHFAAVWGTSIVMLPKFKAGPPITQEDPKTITIDGFHHAVYALAAGFTYDAPDTNTHERKLDKLIKKLHLKGIIKEAGF